MPFVDEMPTRELRPPEGDGEFFVVRLLSWKELEECRREHDRKSLARIRDMGGDLIKAVSEIEHGGEDEQKAAIEEARRENERLAAIESFDRELLVTKSVTGWSYEERFQAARLAKLDEATFTWLFENIAALYLPSEEEGKGDAGSCSTT